MIKQCAWCSRMLGEVEPLDNKETTHGICSECQKKLLDNLKKKTYICPKCNTPYEENKLQVKKITWGRKLREEASCNNCHYRAFLQYWIIKEETK